MGHSVQMSYARSLRCPCKQTQNAMRALGERPCIGRLYAFYARPVHADTADTARVAADGTRIHVSYARLLRCLYMQTQAAMRTPRERLRIERVHASYAWPVHADTVDTAWCPCIGRAVEPAHGTRIHVSYARSVYTVTACNADTAWTQYKSPRIRRVHAH